MIQYTPSEIKELDKEIDKNLVLQGEKLRAEDVSELFGVQADTAVRRIANDGAAPLLAMSTSQHEYNRITPLNRMFSGWELLCQEAGLPLLDTDMVFVCAEEHHRWDPHPFNFLDEDGFGDELVGVKTTADMLACHHDNAKAVMLAWETAVRREFRVAPIVFGHGARSSYASGWKPTPADLVRGYICGDWHAKSQTVLPPLKDKIEVSGHLSEQDPKYRDGFTYYGGHFNFMKIVVRMRKSVRATYKIKACLQGQRALDHWEGSRHVCHISREGHAELYGGAWPWSSASRA